MSVPVPHGQTHLYFSQHFHQSAQVSEISDFLDRTGRRGILAVTLRRGVGRETTTHLLPWKNVMARFRVAPGWKVSEIGMWPMVPREGGRLVFDAGVLGLDGGKP